MFRCPAGRDNTEVFDALRVNDAQNLAEAHAEKNDPLFTIDGSGVNPLDGEWIAKSIGGLFKGHAMLAKICGSFGVILFKI
jgi:hypothetical protein